MRKRSEFNNRGLHKVPELRLQGVLQDKGTPDKNSQGSLMLFEELSFGFESGEKARAAYEAVKPELNRPFERRSKTVMRSNKNVVSLKIIAEDQIAMMATRSSFERLFSALKKIV